MLFSPQMKFFALCPSAPLRLLVPFCLFFYSEVRSNITCNALLITTNTGDSLLLFTKKFCQLDKVGSTDRAPDCLWIQGDVYRKQWMLPATTEIGEQTSSWNTLGAGGQHRSILSLKSMQKNLYHLGVQAVVLSVVLSPTVLAERGPVLCGNCRIYEAQPHCLGFDLVFNWVLR